MSFQPGLNLQLNLLFLIPADAQRFAIFTYEPTALEVHSHPFQLCVRVLADLHQ